MNIELNKYYVTRKLNTVFAIEKTIRNQIKMILPEYMQNKDYWTRVYEEGNYYLNKTESFMDIIVELEDKTEINDLYILDLFQLADYTLNTLYTTAKDKNENVKIYDSENSKIKIYHLSTDKILDYPVVSIFGATHTANKISKLHKALKGS